MSSRRKTLLGNELPQFEEVAEVDDVAEKRRRLSIHQNDGSASLQRKNRIIQENGDLQKSTLNGSTRQASVVQQPKPSNEQLSCLYNNCVKLLNENKINAKNAFQLKLIDYMSDIVLNKEISGGVTNFQVVGCTIDVGTKIYAARVDALHQNTYQMLDGIRRTGNGDEMNQTGLNEGGQNDFDNGNDENNNDEDDQQNKKNKAKKKRMKKSSQIVENLESITAKIRDDFQDEDLYFSKISTCIESEGIGGMLFNKLHYKDDTYEIVINKEEKIYSTREQPIESIELSMKDFVQYHRAKNLDFKIPKLCSDFSNFRYIGWNLEKEDEISKLVQSMIHAENENLEAHRFDANNRNPLNLSDNAAIDHYDDEYLNHDVDVDPDIENLNGPDFNTTENNRGTSIHQSGMEVFDKIDDIRSLNSLNSIADLTTLISNSPSDYSYFNFEKLKLHDLPRHLKRMALQIQNNKTSDSQSTTINSKLVKSGTVRSKKEAPKLDFSIFTDFSKNFKITKKCIYLCDRTLEKRSEKALWFETERQYDFNSKNMFKAYRKLTMAKIYTDVDQVDNLLGNDDIELGKCRKGIVADDDDGHPGGIDDDFEMPCTAQTNEPFFSQNGHEFVQTQAVDVGMDLQQQEMGTLPVFDADHLIEAPLQVNALNIEYAKTSKNIDVRRLKQVIWSLLLATDQKENNDESMSAEKSRQTYNIQASLKDIYHQLKPPYITQKVYDDLSICIVFQMLLFLANEHNLLLKNDPIGSDVIITNY